MKKDYGIIREIKEQPKFPVRELLKVPHQGVDLIVSYPAFGGSTFNGNISEMQKQYTHPTTKEEMSFRESTTAESISAIIYNFKELAKKQIFNPSYLQAGRYVKTSEGVFFNPPKDKKGNVVIDEKVLKNHLNNAEKFNGIYILPNNLVEGVRDFSFVPYETFNQGIQSPEDFAVNPKTNGLARGLEGSKNQNALNLESISKNYEKINVLGFGSVTNPKAFVSVLNGKWGGDQELNVNGGSYFVDDSDGHAFGVMDERK